MIPNYLAEVEAAKVKYADAWTHAHVDGDPRKHEWIKLFAADLHAKDAKAGLNGKRGNPNDLSMDAINYLCEASDSAGRTPEGLPCAVIDVIGGAGGSNPKPIWSPFTTVVEGSGAFVIPGAAGPTPPPSSPSYPYPDENTAGKDFQRRVKQAYTDAGRLFPDPNDQDAFRHFMRFGYSSHEMPEQKAADKHIAELRKDLGL